MMKNSKTVGSMGLAFTFLCLVTILFLPIQAEAKSNVVGVERVNYKINYSLANNLKSLVGKKVSVTLDSGKAFSGLIKEVGDHLIHLEKLDSKEYFDALIRIEDISAIDTRFRTIER
jgi:hypothetical protein